MDFKLYNDKEHCLIFVNLLEDINLYEYSSNFKIDDKFVKISYITNKHNVIKPVPDIPIGCKCITCNNTIVHLSNCNKPHDSNCIFMNYGLKEYISTHQTKLESLKKSNNLDDNDIDKIDDILETTYNSNDIFKYGDKYIFYPGDSEIFSGNVSFITFKYDENTDKQITIKLFEKIVIIDEIPFEKLKYIFNIILSKLDLKYINVKINLVKFNIKYDKYKYTINLQDVFKENCKIFNNNIIELKEDNTRRKQLKIKLNNNTITLLYQKHVIQVFYSFENVYLDNYEYIYPKINELTSIIEKSIVENNYYDNNIIEPITLSTIYANKPKIKYSIHNKNGLKNKVKTGNWYYLNDNMNWEKCKLISYDIEKDEYTIQNDKNETKTISETRLRHEAGDNLNTHVCGDKENCPSPFSYNGRCNDLSYYIDAKGVQSHDGLYYPCCSKITDYGKLLSEFKDFIKNGYSSKDKRLYNLYDNKFTATYDTFNRTKFNIKNIGDVIVLEKNNKLENSIVKNKGLNKKHKYEVIDDDGNHHVVTLDKFSDSHKDIRYFNGIKNKQFLIEYLEKYYLIMPNLKRLNMTNQISSNKPIVKELNKINLSNIISKKIDAYLIPRNNTVLKITKNETIDEYGRVYNLKSCCDFYAFYYNHSLHGINLISNLSNIKKIDKQNIAYCLFNRSIDNDILFYCDNVFYRYTFYYPKFVIAKVVDRKNNKYKLNFSDKYFTINTDLKIGDKIRFLFNIDKENNVIKGNEIIYNTLINNTDVELSSIDHIYNQMYYINTPFNINEWIVIYDDNVLNIKYNSKQNIFEYL